jgi:Uma2 family endonuclease
MATSALVTVSEYLSTSYEPDCEFVDGEVQKRNVGETDHSFLQAMLAHLLLLHRQEWGILAFTEQRVQVTPTRFRIPDVCVIRGGYPKVKIFTSPPFACVEILSPDDRWRRVQEKVEEYLAFGVQYVWVIDPETRKAYEYTTAGMHEVTELRTEDPPIRVPLADLFI